LSIIKHLGSTFEHDIENSHEKASSLAQARRYESRACAE